MPVSTSAKKALRRDIRRAKTNDLLSSKLKKGISTYRKKPSMALLKKVFGLVDTSVKKRLIHINHAGRLKSRLSARLK